LLAPLLIKIPHLLLYKSHLLISSVRAAIRNGNKNLHFYWGFKWQLTTEWKFANFSIFGISETSAKLNQRQIKCNKFYMLPNLHELSLLYGINRHAKLRSLLILLCNLNLTQFFLKGIELVRITFTFSSAATKPIQIINLICVLWPLTSSL
jgi:hypothetical protein